jgi:hypothetical protein
MSRQTPLGINMGGDRFSLRSSAKAARSRHEDELANLLSDLGKVSWPSQLRDQPGERRMDVGNDIQERVGVVEWDMGGWHCKHRKQDNHYHDYHDSDYAIEVRDRPVESSHISAQLP